MDFLTGFHQGGFTAPDAGIGIVACNMGPHVLGQTTFNPLQVLLPLKWTTHIHHNVARRGVVLDLAELLGESGAVGDAASLPTWLR